MATVVFAQRLKSSGIFRSGTSFVSVSLTKSNLAEARTNVLQCDRGTPEYTKKAQKHIDNNVWTSIL